MGLKFELGDIVVVEDIVLAVGRRVRLGGRDVIFLHNNARTQHDLVTDKQGSDDRRS